MSSILRGTSASLQPESTDASHINLTSAKASLVDAMHDLDREAKFDLLTDASFHKMMKDVFKQVLEDVLKETLEDALKEALRSLLPGFWKEAAKPTEQVSTSAGGFDSALKDISCLQRHLLSVINQHRVDMATFGERLLEQVAERKMRAFSQTPDSTLFHNQHASGVTAANEHHMAYGTVNVSGWNHAGWSVYKEHEAVVQ